MNLICNPTILKAFGGRPIELRVQIDVMNFLIHLPMTHIIILYNIYLVVYMHYRDKSDPICYVSIGCKR